MFEVIQTIQSTRPEGDGPKEVVYYRGDDLARAILAVGQAAITHADDTRWVRTLSVALNIKEG